MRKLRITALILVCLGLLIGGIGIGICFVEASSFTYRDTARLNMTQTDTATTFIPVEEGERLVNYQCSRYSTWEMLLSEDAQVPEIKTDSQQEKGTIRADVTYRSVPGFTLDLLVTYSYSKEEDIILQFYHNVGTEALLSAKDQILSDIKNRRIGEYVWAEITGVTFTVNPADRDKIEPLFG